MTLKPLWSAWTSAYTSLTAAPRASAFILLSFIALNAVCRHFPGDPFREGKMVLFLLSAALAGSLWIARRSRGLGLAHATLVLLWGVGGVKLYGLVPIAMPLALLGLAEICARNRGFFLAMLRVTTWAQMLLGTYQLGGGEIWGKDPAFLYTIQGSFGHNVVAGCFFAMVAPVAFRFWSAKEGLLVALFCLLSSSTMATLSLLAALLYFLWRLRGRDAIYLGLIAALPCIFGAVFFPQIEFFSFSGRFLPWSRALGFILENPFGYGPGSWFGEYPRWEVPYHRIWGTLHNDWLQLLFEGGVATLGFFLVGCFSVLKRVSPWAGCAITAFLVNALGGFPMHLAPLSFLAVCFLVFGAEET